jgi:cobalt-zinc-cadmium efflux system outer membrane protein
VYHAGNIPVTILAEWRIFLQAGNIIFPTGALLLCVAVKPILRVTRRLKNRSRRWFCISLLYFALAATSFGQDAPAQSPAEMPATPSLSLAQAKEMAFTRNWDLLAAKSGIDSATAQLIVTKEYPNPTVSGITTKIGSHDNATILGNSIWNRSYDTIAAVNQLVEIAGKRGDRQAGARAGIQGAEARFRDAQRVLEQGVTKAFTAALLAGENVRILNQSSGYLLHQAKIAEERFKSGDLSDSDKKKIEINAEQYELQAKAAEAAAVQARVAVEILLGNDQPKGNWLPQGSLDSMVADDTENPQLIADHTGVARADVIAADADLRASVANLKLQKAYRIPDPTFTVQYEHEPPGGGPPIDTFGVGVSFPLPLWNRNGGNIRAAQASVDQSRYSLEKIKAQVIADIVNAEANYHEAYTRWVRYRDQTNPKSKQVRESLAFAYQKGGASLLDLLDAERTEAQMNSKN